MHAMRQYILDEDVGLTNGFGPLSGGMGYLQHGRRRGVMGHLPPHLLPIVGYVSDLCCGPRSTDAMCR